ncbi:MAG: Xaa-Pro peptidase family protein [Oscillospiraceae bacterium]|nr:Xaa-Pro peptidase family protein [Oscillospiraceae bacterium]
MNHFAAIRAQLDRCGVDAMLLTNEANRFYASGFHSTGTDGVAFVTKKNAYYWTDSRYIEAAGQAVTDAEVALTTVGRSYAALINEASERDGVETIGFEDEYMTVAELRQYSERLHATLKPATALMTGLRMVKDEEELAALIGAQRIAERALSEIYNDIRPGVTEKEIAAKLTYLMLRYGAENMSFDPIVASGANGSKPHAVPSEKQIAAGEFVTMDFGCIYHGYCSDMTRTVAVGHVSEEMDTVYHTVLRAQLAGIAAAKAGVPGCDVHNAAAKVIADAGYGAYFGHGFGHGVGVEIHESPRASTTWTEPLPVGAVISAEPGIYLPGRFGVRIEDVIVIRGDGCEDIHRAPKELLILP